VPFEYTPIPANFATFTMPSPGDPRIAASVDLPMSQLADKIEWARLGAQVSAGSITGTQTNYTATGWPAATVWRVAASGNVLFNGFDSTAVGLVKLKLLVNASAFTVSIGHATGAAGNQCVCPSAVTFVLGAGDSCYLWYDDTSTAWRVISTPRGSNYVWSGLHLWSQSLLLGNNVEVLYEAPRARVSKVPIAHFEATGASPWYWATGFAYLASTGNTVNGAMRIPFRLPSGSILKGALAGVKNTGAGQSITMYVYKHTHNILSDGLGSRVQLGTTATSSGSTSVSIISSGAAFAETVLNADTEYYCEFHASATALQELHWLAISWDDVGPRSY
jgi:hypothetical protein